MVSSLHETFMQRCLDLALQGLGNVAPNPLVGSVVVHNGKIIGEGYHQKFGAAHAEVNAINSVTDKKLLSESTLYVNLEPCSHFGKTPPCADLIIEKKIPKVVVASFDPNPQVAGKGIHRLERAGVEVVSGVLQQQADYLNRRFFTFHTKHRPFIILKWAQSADGFMAANEPKQIWLSNEESKKLVHKWRTEEQGILVGSHTVAIDDCELTARLWKGKQPVRMVIDRQLSLPAAKKIFDAQATTLIFNEREDRQNETNHYIKIDFSKNPLLHILSAIYQLGILSVIVEGGQETLQHFIAQNLWDEIRVFSTEQLLVRGKKSPSFKGISVSETSVENNGLQIYRNYTA